jgi:hydrogenase maturation factor HypE
VIDSDINDTDEAKGEPDVTVNGKVLRMVQAVDGNWYGYFADRLMAIAADQQQMEQ